MKYAFEVLSLEISDADGVNQSAAVLAALNAAGESGWDVVPLKLPDTTTDKGTFLNILMKKEIAS